MGPIDSKDVKKTFFQLICYGGMGLIGTGVHYIAFLSCIRLNLLDPVFASNFGYVLGAVTNYFLNYYITFKHNSDHIKTIVKFFIVAFIGLGVNYSIFSVSFTYFELHYLISQIIATGMVFGLTFVMNKLWTYN